MALWLAWIMTTTAIFTVVPLGPWGLLGWLGAAGPLVRIALPSFSGRRIAAIGLVALLAIVVLGGERQWFEIVVPCVTLLIGIRLRPDSRSHASESSDSASRDRLERSEFDAALARELARARRHERPLMLLSISCSDAKNDLRRLKTATSAQIHIYARVFDLESRLLVILPEFRADARPTLYARILGAAKANHIDVVSLGSARFPHDQITAAGLIEAADTNRRLATGCAEELVAHESSGRAAECPPELSSS